MSDPLINMMKILTPYRAGNFLDEEAGDLSVAAVTSLPWMERLTPKEQDELLFFAYKYAENRLRRVLN